MDHCCRGWYWKQAGASLLVMGGAIAQVVVLFPIVTFGNCALAQVIPDGTLGAESSVVTPTSVNGLPSDQIDGGATRGSNLFHSFEQFSIPALGEAFFNNAPEIQNIVSRVTGESISNIDGWLTANGTANLFLLNPNGIVFGPNARLSIGGSFVGSTASSLNFADGNSFSATAHPITPLLTVSVPVGLQYGGTAGSISSLGSTLRVSEGQSLLLLGGNVTLDGSFLYVDYSQGGRIELGGLSGSGTVGLNVDGNNLSLSYPDQVQRADVSLTNGTSVNVTAGGGGDIVVNARNLDISGGSRLDAGIGEGLGTFGSRAGNIEINATDRVRISGETSEFSGIYNLVGDLTGGTALGSAGDIVINTGSLEGIGNFFIASATGGQGNAGNVTIQARDSVSLASGVGSGVGSIVGETGVGNGANVTIETRSFSLSNNTVLSTSTSGRGNAGNVNINALDTVSFNGGGAVSTVESGAVGNGGDINITARSLSTTNGAQLDSSTFGQGNAGSVNINALDTASFDGASAFSTVESGAVGNGGDINITARSLSITNGAELNSSTFGQGNAGSVNINALDTVSFDGGVVFSTVELGAVGNGGDINITARSLSTTNGAQLNSSTFEQGNAGSVNINALDTVSFDGGVVFSTVGSGAVGNGGDISITARSLSLTDGGTLSAETSGRGNAGRVSVQADDSVSIANSVISSTVRSEAVGKGGDISIQGRSLSVTSGASLLAQTFGEGNAGNIQVNATDFVELSGVTTFPATEDGSPGGFSSGLFTTTEQGASSQGGELSVTTGTLRISDGAVLSARSRSAFRGGNITVNANELEVTGGGQLLTTAFSGGDAGNINVNVTNRITISSSDPTFFDRFNSVAEVFGEEQAQYTIDPVGPASGIFASAASGRGGNITIQAQDLVLRNQSQISTSAGTASAGGNGGNIKIDADFLVGLENSDITANSFEGEGGFIDITATEGVFGLERRDILTEDSDITAFSQRDPALSGEIAINTPDVDPSQGLIILPAELVDVSNQIAQGCPASVARGESKFVITGRGGLPPNPNEPLTGDNVLTDWNTLDSDTENRPDVENRSSAEEGATNSTRESANTQIVEANGWMINNKGDVVLTASAPTATLDIPWLPDSDCHAPKAES